MKPGWRIVGIGIEMLIRLLVILAILLLLLGALIHR